MVTENSNNDSKYINGTEITLEQIKNIETELKTEEKKETEEKEKLQYFTE